MTPLHTINVRVYYEDTDAGGIVYHANYLRYLERARTEWLRALGIDQQRRLRDTGTGFVVAECSLRFVRPARLDDALLVDVGLDDAQRGLRAASLRLHQRITRVADGQCLVDARVRVGCVELGRGRPVPLPAELMQALQRHAGRAPDAGTCGPAADRTPSSDPEPNR